MPKTIFERTEKKYVITITQKNELLKLISEIITSDEYGKSNVNSIYYDTDDYRLIRNSIVKPVYKEKLRLRSYSIPNADSTVFLELKKKYKGVVYKRRKTLKYSDAQNYLKFHIMPDNSQIMREIDWTMSFYKSLKPKMFIGYDRLAYVGKEDKNLRITFDFNLRFRTDKLSLDCGNYGYTDSGTLTSGTEITEITMSEENYSSGGGSMHGGGMRGGPGGMPPR